MRLQIKDMSLRNFWRHPSGELGSRPGLRLLASSPGAQAASRIDWARTVKDQITGDVWHYVVTSDGTAGADVPSVTIHVLDEDLKEHHSVSVVSERRPEAVTIARATNTEWVLISSPDFETHIGTIGGPLAVAEKVESVNPNTSALDVPSGLIVSWVGRMVVAKGAQLFISDPITATGGDPRTFVAQNVLTRPGAIYGLHTVGTSLVCCTTEGVFALGSDAAAAGQIAVANWRKLTDHVTASYNSTANAQGQIYGLTERGAREVGTDASPEQLLDEPNQPRAYAARVARHNWRDAHIVESDQGPIISDEQGAFLRTDMGSGLVSWWTMTHDDEEGKIRGTLTEPDGSELIVTTRGIYRAEGNFDGGLESTSENSTAVQAIAAANVEAPAGGNPTLRHIHVTSDSDGNLLSAARGTQNDGAAAGTSGGLVLGVDDWDGGSLWTAQKLRTRRGDFAENGSDLPIEVGAERPLQRIGPDVAIVIKGRGKARPVNQ